MSEKTMTSNPSFVSVPNLQVHPQLYDFINQELLAELGLEASTFWREFGALVTEFAPRNRALLATRDHLQTQLDQWHRNHKGAFDFQAYKTYLTEIGYLQAPGDDFFIHTANVDTEIALQAGPQLVVPVMNARFALNACNARWGSLYDALYGTDVIPQTDGATKTVDYNPLRGDKVVQRGREFLNQHFPLLQGDFHDVTGFKIEQQQLLLEQGPITTHLVDSRQWSGYRGDPKAPEVILFNHHGLSVEIQIDKMHVIGACDKAGIKDIVLESALTTIMDCEDSVAAVDAEDKVLVYRNWLGLMKGDLAEQVVKNNRTFTRTLAADREYISPTGKIFTLPGRSLMFVRNVGHLMTTPAMLDEDNQQVPEGIMDGVVTSLAALFDLRSKSRFKNSRTGSVYIVKPKMHGPEEVAFTNDLFAAIEQLLNIPADTLKVGIMDEERRTSVNLKECIRAAQSRVAFVNTGFLDRTGDEIHTSMEAGPFAPKDMIKSMEWIKAYELNNVAVGLACGFQGKAQIGKGMWAMPDNMADMMVAKIAQPRAGANTAWVPSPTAATLHALHYHTVNVNQVQTELNTLKPNVDDLVDKILTIPLLGDTRLTAEQIQQELENNAQGILGYVVRWIDQGVGCSKVPDIHNTPLMEDRATLRISSQHICNWLYHGICTDAQVMSILKAMAMIVDQQNAKDSMYRPMAANLATNVAFAAATDLILKGKEQPNGYTEPLLHTYRLRLKTQ